MNPLPCAAPDIPFFEWVDSLSDEDHYQVLLELRRIAAELGVTVERKPVVAHHLLDLEPHSPSVISLN